MSLVILHFIIAGTVLTSCGSLGQTTDSASTLSCPDGIAPNSEDCQSFYMCEDDVMLVLYCPSGYMFDDVKGACSDETEVDCGSRNVPNTTEVLVEQPHTTSASYYSTPASESSSGPTTGFSWWQYTSAWGNPTSSVDSEGTTTFPWWQYTSLWGTSTPKNSFTSGPSFETTNNDQSLSTTSSPNVEFSSTTSPQLTATPPTWWSFTKSSDPAGSTTTFPWWQYTSLWKTSTLSSNPTGVEDAEFPVTIAPWSFTKAPKPKKIKEKPTKKPKIPKVEKKCKCSDETPVTDVEVFPSTTISITEGKSSEKSEENLLEIEQPTNELTQIVTRQVYDNFGSRFCPPLETGYFPHPYNPRRYFYCWNGKIAMNLRCQGNSFFDETTKSCTFPKFPGWNPYRNWG